MKTIPMLVRRPRKGAVTLSLGGGASQARVTGVTLARVNSRSLVLCVVRACAPACFDVCAAEHRYAVLFSFVCCGDSFEDRFDSCLKG